MKIKFHSSTKKNGEELLGRIQTIGLVNFLKNQQTVIQKKTTQKKLD